MSRETDRLIADRGHGMSQTMRTVLETVAGGLVRRDELVPRPYDFRLAGGAGDYIVTRTVRALERRELVRRGKHKPGTRYSTWELTPDGYTLARRMGIEASPPRWELSPEDRAECADEARMKRLEDR